MSPDQKPEWFEITEADNSASVRKVSKKLPLLALVAVAGILGVGAVMAQTQNEPPANATENIVPDQSLTPAQSSAGNESIAPPDSAIAPQPGSPAGPGIAPKAPAPGIANPNIGVPPTGGEHEDDGGIRPPRPHHGDHEGGDDGEEGDDD